MPQLSQDPTTKEWVIIATERAKRPHDFKMAHPVVERPPYKEDCPFCPGNERLTPHETLAYRSGGQPIRKGGGSGLSQINFQPSLQKEVWRERRRRGISG